MLKLSVRLEDMLQEDIPMKNWNVQFNEQKQRIGHCFPSKSQYGRTATDVRSETCLEIFLQKLLY